MRIHRISFLFFVVIVTLANVSTAESESYACFQIPKIKFIGLPFSQEDLNSPRIRVENNAEEAEKLRQDMINHCIIKENTALENIGSSFCWQPHVQESYTVADKIFQEIAKVLRHCHGEETLFSQSVILSFPSLSRQTDLEKLANVLKSSECKKLLGIQDASAGLYPASPAPYISIAFLPRNGAEPRIVQESQGSSTTDKNARSNTEDWVNNFLGKFRLCPYTSSVSRAAVGLSSVGVPVGGIHFRVSSTEEYNAKSDKMQKAAELVSAFWSEVSYLLQSSQEDWATSLVVFPEYDEDFESFVEICDNIVEPTVAATQSTDFIGRAWFHPLYTTDAVGHASVIAGHAIPHKIVKDFMVSMHDGKQKLLDDEELAKANDRVRRTPHATINILRRSQLLKAGEYEKSLGEKRPKPNSVYVRNALRLSEAKNKI